MVVFHAAMDDLHQFVTAAEREQAKWHPVGDVLLDVLQQEIDHCKVSRAHHRQVAPPADH